MSELIDRSDKFNWDLEDIEIEEPEQGIEAGMQNPVGALAKQKKRAVENARPTT